MTTVAIEQAQKDLFRLVDEVALGEHVVITKDQVPVAELVPVAHPAPKPVFGSARLSQQARELIEDQRNAKLVSIASLWEMGIKISLGRLDLAQPFEELIPKQLQMNGFGLLPLRIPHIAKVISLPFHHRDPFDRVIVGQGLAEDLSLVSADPTFDKYSVHRRW